jgi:glycosyltransferase involved in cell wall biosynthesis
MIERQDPGSRTLRILIVAHAFPPLNAVASHRPYSWARAWRDLGHEIHVLTPAKYPFDGAVDNERDFTGIHVHEVAYLPMAPSARNSTSSAPGQRIERWEWLKTVTRRVRFALGTFGDLRLLACFPMVRRGVGLIRQHGIQLIVATAPPESVFFVARRLSRRTGVPWVADFRDLWFHDMVLFRTRLTSWLLGPINRWLVSSAAALVTVSRGLMDRLSRYLGREVILSHNGFLAEDYGSGPPAPPSSNGRTHFVYTGRVYPEKQDPELLFHALTTLRGTMADLAARISVDFYGFEDPRLRTLIERHGVADCVKLRGFVPYRESVAIQRAADYLLFLDWTDTRAEGVLTGKLFEYLGSGRPILALGIRKDSEAARLISDAGCGTILTGDDEIAEYLRRALASPRPRANEPEAVGKFSRERQARALLDEITRRLS